MKKPFKTYNQQLKILRKRNMIIKNGSKAISILRRENYYCVINGYKDIFLTRANPDVYRDGTTFEQVYALYEFDRNLRSIFLKYLLQVESYLKSQIAYCFSDKRREMFSYFNINNFGPDTAYTTNLISKLSKQIDRNKKSKTIKHYLTDHKELPLWVLAKKLTFGDANSFFKAMQSSDRQTITTSFIKEFCREYRHSMVSRSEHMYTPEVIDNMLMVMCACRNVCAHEERLYDFQQKSPAGFTLNHILGQPQFQPRLFNIYLVLGFFLCKKDYKLFSKQISKEITSLQSELPERVFKSVHMKMGFPKDWRSRSGLLPSSYTSEKQYT